MDAGSGSPFATYDPGACFCEMLHGHAAGSPHGRLVRERFASVPIAELRARARDAEIELFDQGITFTVYSERDAIDRILPFDVIPRVLTAADWRTIETGVRQRVAAINRFLDDVYHDQKILCRERAGLHYTLDHLAELVVKPVGESGGYGIPVGPRASAAELEACRARLEAAPANYISQPMIGLSVCPTLPPSGIEPRHVDLR